VPMFGRQVFPFKRTHACHMRSFPWLTWIS
jgi:hypothetical protein